MGVAGGRLPRRSDLRVPRQLPALGFNQPGKKLGLLTGNTAGCGNTGAHARFRAGDRGCLDFALETFGLGVPGPRLSTRCHPAATRGKDSLTLGRRSLGYFRVGASFDVRGGKTADAVVPVAQAQGCVAGAVRADVPVRALLRPRPSRPFCRRFNQLGDRGRGRESGCNGARKSHSRRSSHFASPKEPETALATISAPFAPASDLAGALLAPSAPTLLLGISFYKELHWSFAATQAQSIDHIHFNARGPPVA